MITSHRALCAISGDIASSELISAKVSILNWPHFSLIESYYCYKLLGKFYRKKSIVDTEILSDEVVKSADSDIYHH